MSPGGAATTGLHLCFLCNEYPPEPHGGIGTSVQALARALVAQGHRVTVVGVSRSGAGTDDDAGVRVIRLRHARWRGAGFVVNGHRVRRALHDLHRADPVDVVEAPEIGLAVLPRRFEPAAVIRMHGGHHFFAVTLGREPRPWRGWLERRSFARADHLCAVSSFVASTTRDLLHLGDRPITVLPNGVDTDRFSPRPGEAVPGRLLFAGTVCEKKGIRQLVEAMPAIVARIPEARLTVAGRDWIGDDGRSFTEGLRSSLDADTERRVEFLGPVDHAEMPALLGAASVCVYPAHMEAMPLAWLEAMSAGRPIVASCTGPGPEVIEDGVSGLLCDPYDPSSIADAVCRLLGDAELRHRLGAAARRRAVGEFAMATLVTRNVEFYEQCIGRAHGGTGP